VVPAAFIGSAGTAANPIALAFAMLSAGHSTFWVSVSVATNLVVTAGLLPVGGVLADRLSRRRLLVSCQVTSGLTQASLGTVVLVGEPTVGTFVIAAVITGASAAVFSPTFGSSIPTLVAGTPSLQNGNALLRMAINLGLTVGGPVSGVLIPFVGAGWIIVGDGLTFLLSAVLLAGIVLPRRTEDTRASFWREAMLGFAFVRDRPWLLRGSLTFGIVYGCEAGSLPVLGPAVLHGMRDGAWIWGVAMGCAMAGSVLAGILMVRSSRALTLRGLFGILPMFALFPAMLASGSAAIPVLFLAALVAAGALEVAEVGWFATVQEQVPDSILSRVSSVDSLVNSALTPIFAIITGILVSHLAVPVVALVISAVTVLATGAMWLSSDNRFETGRRRVTA
jgi:hypothetical protein